MTKADFLLNLIGFVFNQLNNWSLNQRRAGWMMLSGEILLGRVIFLGLVKARLGRPHYGFQTRPPRSIINPGQPERQTNA